MQSWIRRALGATLLMAAGGAMAAAPTVPSLRLYVFQCGTIEVSDISIFSPGFDKDKHKTLTSSCYLIAHPKGTLMWDTGFGDALAAQAGGVQASPVFHISLKKSLAEQFKEIGYQPQDIQYLGISHMHFDHIGNAALFPTATLLMQQEEVDAAFGPEPGKVGFDPKNYPTMFKNPQHKLSGDFDVFGDGSVVIKRAVGHTPGHQSLFLKLPKTGNVMLSGDLAHFTENWEKRRVPSFNFNKEQSVKAMEDMAEFMKANKAQLWIQHDVEQNATIQHAPAFYQ
jgi:glyoxylase-like metal-dependent hydrolase (beta-lactamase superfamily II)